MDDAEYISVLAEELMDIHPDKYRFATEKPEFACWFVGRIMFNRDFKFDEALVRSVVHDLISLKP